MHSAGSILRARIASRKPRTSVAVTRTRGKAFLLLPHSSPDFPASFMVVQAALVRMPMTRSYACSLPAERRSEGAVGRKA